MFYNFLSSLVGSKYLFIFSFSFICSLSSDGTAKFFRWQVLFFFTSSSFCSFERFSHQHWLIVFQVSSSLQDFSLSSVGSQQCCSLNGLHSTSYFQVLQSLYPSFGDRAERTNYNWYHSHFNVPQFFQFSSEVLVLISFFAFFQF